MSELYELFSQHPRISTDTRRIEPDSIFFALRGDTFDGNHFVAEALEKGAAYAVSDDPQVAASDERQRIVLVDDTLKALQDLARCHRRAARNPDPRHLGQQRQNHHERACQPRAGRAVRGLRHPRQPQQPHRRAADAARHDPRHGVRRGGDGRERLRRTGSAGIGRRAELRHPDQHRPGAPRRLRRTGGGFAAARANCSTSSRRTEATPSSRPTTKS